MRTTARPGGNHGHRDRPRPQPRSRRAPEGLGPPGGGGIGAGFLRFGAGCAVVGGILAVIFNLLHPRSSDVDDIEAELRLIEDHGEWLFVHVGILVSVLVLLPGLVALARSLDVDKTAAWARMALYAGLVSLPLALLTVAIDGIAMNEIAEDWASAGPDQAEVLRTAEIVGNVGIATFDVFIIMLFGVTPLFAGVALLGSKVYPRWIGRTAVAAGVLGMVTGFIQSFAGLGTATTNVMFPLASLAFTIVIVAAGFTLWRRVDAVT